MKSITSDIKQSNNTHKIEGLNQTKMKVLKYYCL